MARTAELLIQQTIDIPRILVVPRGETKSGFRRFALDLSGLRYDAPRDMLWAAHLRTGAIEHIDAGGGLVEEQRLEDLLVDELCAFGDVAYDAHADLLYDLAGQVTAHLLGRLTEEDAGKVLRLYQTEIAAAVHDQMQRHAWRETESGWKVEVKRGFTQLRDSAYTLAPGDAVLDYRSPPPDKGGIARHLFGGFQRCLYMHQKFQSDTERQLAAVLERDAEKWFKPAKGQFQLYYRSGSRHLEYQPDFVAETAAAIIMLECKAANRMTDPDVLAKRDVAVRWCGRASAHAMTHGGKPWRYLLVPHSAVAENVTLAGLAARYAESLTSAE